MKSLNIRQESDHDSEIVISPPDYDNEICIEITENVTSRIYLSIHQAKKIAEYLQKITP